MENQTFERVKKKKSDLFMEIDQDLHCVEKKKKT